NAPPATAAKRPAQQGEQKARTDLFGDPLPDGALARMGTTRLRQGENVNQVLFTPDGKTVVSGGMDNTVRLWDVATGKLVRSLKHPVREVRPLSFARDGKTLATSARNQLWLWDVGTGAQLRELNLQLERDQQVTSLTLSSDGKTAASGEMGGIIRLWDMASGN